VDDDSIDVTLAAKGGGNTFRSPKLDIQLKCHACDFPEDSEFTFPLKLKNYNDLRDKRVLVPRILVVVLVPLNESGWCNHSEKQLILQYTGYWFSLRDFAESSNSTSVTVQIPRSQQFSPDALKAIMNRISEGGFP